jgi:hypothetical protein
MATSAAILEGAMNRNAPSIADVGAEVVSLSAFLGVVSMALFPLALPGLLLFVGIPLLLLAPGLLLAPLLLIPLALSRLVRRGRSRRRDRLAGPADQDAATGQRAVGRVGVAGR